MSRAKVLKGYPDPISKDVIESIARTLWVTAYAAYAQENRDDDSLERAGAGEDWYDVVPDTPAGAFQAADVVGKSLEALNHKTLADLAWEARNVATGKARTENMGDFAERVGRYLAMETLGSGVRWTDDQPGFAHRVPPYFEVGYDGRYLEWSPRDPVKTGGREMGSVITVDSRGSGYSTWYVVRVDGDDRDTYAAETLEGAIDLANADPGSRLEWGTVEARDAGAARLGRPARWMRVNPAAFTKKGERMYKQVERGYRAAGDARAKEIAARTVQAAAKHGVRGLVRNPDVLRPGDRVSTPDNVRGVVIKIQGGDHPDEAQVELDTGVVVRGEDGGRWWYPLRSLRRLRRNPDVYVKVGDLVVTPDNEIGRVVEIGGDEAQVLHEDRRTGRGPWYFPVASLLEPHEDAVKEYLSAVAAIG